MPTGLPMLSKSQSGRRTLTNAKRASLLTLALCMFVTFFAALERQASARTEIEGGSAIVRSSDGLIRAGDGCALVENGDRTVAAGSCDEQKDSSGQSEQIPPPEEETTVIPETTSPESTLAEETTPTGEEEDLCPAEPPGDAIRAKVARAVDGDTLELADEVGGTDQVRLIGLDAPELEEDGRAEPYAEEAAAFTADALEGKDVLLAPGEEETDDYGRLLAYVWIVPEEGLLGSLKRKIDAGGSELFNRTLLREGYAEILTIQPDDVYADCFEAAQREAQDAGEGIWAAQETTFFEETTSLTDTASPEPTSPGSTSEPTTPTVSEQTTTPEDASEETISFPQEQTTRLERRGVTPVDEATIDRNLTVVEEATAGEEPHAASRLQYEDAWSPPASASPNPSDETTSGTVIDLTSPPVGSLPVADTPQGGPVSVLPATGGSSLLALFGAMVLISLGLAALFANNASPRNRPDHHDEDR
jgi:endonuclease YncB( thermonuclease family)